MTLDGSALGVVRLADPNLTRNFNFFQARLWFVDRETRRRASGPLSGLPKVPEELFNTSANVSRY
jgi:hypothetical protein